MLTYFVGIWHLSVLAAYLSLRRASQLYLMYMVSSASRRGIKARSARSPSLQRRQFTSAFLHYYHKSFLWHHRAARPRTRRRREASWLDAPAAISVANKGSSRFFMTLRADIGAAHRREQSAGLAASSRRCRDGRATPKATSADSILIAREQARSCAARVCR